MSGRLCFAGVPRLSRRGFAAGAAATTALLGAPWARAGNEISIGLTPVFLDSDIQLLADLKSYLDADDRLCELYRDNHGWARKAILNVAGSGIFTCGSGGYFRSL